MPRTATAAIASAPPAPRWPFPLWLPPGLALLVGGLVALFVALSPAPAPPPTPVALAPSPVAVDDAGDRAVPPDGPIPYSYSAPDDAFARVEASRASQGAPAPRADEATPVAPSRATPRRTAYVPPGAVFAPRRVSDLKPNPFIDSIWGDLPDTRWPRFERVGPLKPNPFRE